MTDTASRLIVVGDVHGEADRLSRLFDWLGSFDGIVVMVGDYVNRGPQSRTVLEILCEEKRRRASKLVLLRGNHEVALMNFLDGGSLADFALHGGLATMRSYLEGLVTDDAVAQFRRGFPRDHLSLLRQTATFYVSECTLISHAGFDADYPTDFTSTRLVDGDPRIFQFDGQWPRPTVVVGHYLQSSQQPLVGENLIAIDTGCGTIVGAPLTAVGLPDRVVFQF